MDTSITIEEQRHRVWKTGTYISAALAMILGIIFWNMEDPFWVGIFRLAAFIFFSLSIFGLLKDLGEPLLITLNSTPKHLLIDYKKGKKIIQEEQFDRSSIDDLVASTETPINRIPFIHPQSATIKITFNDGHQALNLFKYSGRTLFFEEAKIQEALLFLQSQNITSKPHRTS